VMTGQGTTGVGLFPDRKTCGSDAALGDLQAARGARPSTVGADAYLRVQGRSLDAHGRLLDGTVT
jgi:hypothetical protein